MILEFKIKNFRSILEQQTLSLVASQGDEHVQNILTVDKKLKLLPVSVIYGANASGKSNLLSALLFMRYFILTCAKESQPGEIIPVEGFSFNENSRQEPSEFEVIFIKDGIRYQYGFIVDNYRIHEEWLLAYPSVRAQQWFSRIYDKKADKYLWKFSPLFKHSKHVVGLTRHDVLFLSNSVTLNNEQLAPIFSWFQKDLLFIDSRKERDLSYKKSIDYIKSEEGKKLVLRFMQVADPSIKDITLDVEKRTEDSFPSFPSSIPKEVQEYFKTSILKSGENLKLKFVHSNNVSLNLKDESDGTCRLLSFAGRWIDALENGRVLIVDELENSLHPLVVKFLVDLICNPEINKKNTQLIFTTHSTFLLDDNLFRRDQIWFVEKDKNNSSHIYPLLDFSPRKNEAVGKGYLQGRYGALPYVGEWRF